MHPQNHYKTVTTAEAKRLGFSMPITQILRPKYYAILDKTIADFRRQRVDYILVNEHAKHRDRISLWRRQAPVSATHGVMRVPTQPKTQPKQKKKQ